MIMNPFSCENCKRELQPENLGINVNEEGELVRICMFCGNEVIVK
jgi:hypothetical protein